MKKNLLPLPTIIFAFFFCANTYAAETATEVTKKTQSPLAGSKARDSALSPEPRLVIPSDSQSRRLFDNPDSTLWDPYRFMEPEYPTSMSTQLLAKSGSVSATGGAASAPAAPGEAVGSEHGSVAEVAAKLSNPVSSVWGLFTQFGLTSSDGDVNQGDDQFGGNILFQPILPIPLFGKGKDQWKLITRPTVPFLMGTPVPEGFDDFGQKTGLGDTLLPLVLVPPVSLTGNWLLGLGPTFTLPTSTIDAFGRQQWAIGPTGVLGYKTKKWVGGIFPQYYFGVGSRGDQGKKPDASYMNMFYFFIYNLPEAWQVGFNPTINYDNKATDGNQWNVPVGLLVAKTTKIWNRPVKFQFGVEYSVVSQDTFGQRVLVKLNIIPVIQSFIKEPLFGGS
jgi:hypothetical protein